MIQYEFLQFGWKDLLDVLIVSVIIYEALKLMKGTRSAQITSGLLTILAIAVVAYWFQLEGLTWLFSNLATFGLIVLVIVFQPELRSVLARWGESPLWRGFSTLERKKWLEEVCKAAIRLSDLSYGGLIVIERKTGLRNFAESGKVMHADVSSELLVTLFTPYTPLHDGAIIISGNTVVAAAASLPLTNNPRYKKLYGMRHKAAIGVSEQSDAVVVVVSEETNAISIASEGILDSDIPKSELRDRLATYFRK